MFPGEEKDIVTSPGHKFELHYLILLEAPQLASGIATRVA